MNGQDDFRQTGEMEQKREMPPVYAGERARQGEIVLRRRWERRVFVAGLAGIILLAVLFPILAHLNGP